MIEKVKYHIQELGISRIMFYILMLVAFVSLSVLTIQIQDQKKIIAKQKKEIENIKSSEIWGYGTKMKNLIDKNYEAKLYRNNAEKKIQEYTEKKEEIDSILSSLE